MVIFYWPVTLFGLLMLAVALWIRRNWWLLLLLPIFLVPLGGGAMLIYACTQGDCL